MKELTINVSDGLYGKLLLIPQSEEFIVSLIEKALSQDEDADPDQLSDLKGTLESIDSRLASIELKLGKPDDVASFDTALPKAEPPSPKNLPDTSSFYRKLAVVSGMAVDTEGPDEGAPDNLERSILMYVAPGIEIKKSILLNLLSIRFPEEDIEQKIRRMVIDGVLYEFKKGEEVCVRRG